VSTSRSASERLETSWWPREKFWEPGPTRPKRAATSPTRAGTSAGVQGDASGRRSASATRIRHRLPGAAVRASSAEVEPAGPATSIRHDHVRGAGMLTTETRSPASPESEWGEAAARRSGGTPNEVAIQPLAMSSAASKTI
jgi:hypothetical protein